MPSESTVKAATVAVDLINLALTALQAHAKIQAMLAKAQSEGRADLTTEEWDALNVADAEARERLASLLLRSA